MNAEIRGFEVSIRQFIEDNKTVPLEVKYLVLRAITGEIKEQADAAVIAEFKEREVDSKDVENIQ